MLLDGFDQYAVDNIDPVDIDARHRIPREVIGDLADMGFFGLSIPESHGGAGFGLLAVCRAIERIAQRDRSVATTVGLHLGLGTRGMIAFGSDRVKDRYLPDLAEGKRIAAFAATEPGAGSDLTGIATRLSATGGQLSVRGTKIFVTNGGFADVFTLLTSSPGLGGAQRGHSLVVMERDDHGLTIGPEEGKLGLRGSSTVSLHLDDVVVPNDRIIGDAGKGMSHAAHVLAWGRTVMASGCTGAARSALALTARHVQHRRQFRKTLGQQPVVREQVAHMAARLFAMEAMVTHTGVADDPASLMRRSTAAKVLCSEGDWLICDRAIQLHGGTGFIEESGLPLLLRDARITRIFEGANDVLLSHLGIMTAVDPVDIEADVEVADPVLARALADLACFRNEYRSSLKETFGIRLMRQPRQLARLGTLAMLCEASVATARHAQREGTPNGLTLAHLWMAMVSQQIPALLAPLEEIENIDAVVERVFDGATP